MVGRPLVKLDSSVVNFRPMVETPIMQLATDRRGRLVREGSSSKEPSPLSEQGQYHYQDPGLPQPPYSQVV